MGLNMDKRITQKIAELIGIFETTSPDSIDTSEELEIILRKLGDLTSTEDNDLMDIISERWKDQELLENQISSEYMTGPSWDDLKKRHPWMLGWTLEELTDRSQLEDMT